MHKVFVFRNIEVSLYFYPRFDILELKLFSSVPVDTIFEISLFGIGFGVYINLEY